MSRSIALGPGAARPPLRTLVASCAYALLVACADDDTVAASTYDAGNAGPTLLDASALGEDANAGGAHEAGLPLDAGTTLPGAEASTLTPGGCSLGEATSLASDQSLDLFGSITYFASGKSLPAGRYRVAYVDGCMKFNPVLPWSVNNAASQGWLLVGTSSSDLVIGLPGGADNGFLSSFETFEQCVAKNQKLPAKEFDFVGGKLGIWLDDGPYTDNQAGEGGRNPRWRLTLLVQECPPELL